MTGLISKQDAINAVSEYALTHTDLDADKLNGLVKVIMKLPEPQRWIPVSERLPNVDEWVLTSEDTGFVWIQSLWKNYDGSLEWDYEGLRIPFEATLAWMPLPEPFEAFDGAINPTEE